MIFWTTLILTALGVILWGWMESLCGATSSVICGIIAVIMLIGIIFANTNLEGQIELLQEEKTAIEYKIDSGLFTDKFDIQDKNIVDEVFAYNSKIIEGKRLQHNFWVGIFYPDIYDVLETIDYATIQK